MNRPLVCFILLLGLSLGLCTHSFGMNKVLTYPAPVSERTNNAYRITVNGQSVDVYTAQSEYFEGDYYFASFDFSGKVTIEITSPFPMDQTKLLPERFEIQTKSCDSKSIVLEANKPFRISVEPKGRIKPLLLFGNELEKDIPDPKSPNVIYFGPGIHKTDMITVKSNQTLYLAGGAVVKGSILAKGDNIVIRGRGILAGEDYSRFKGPGRFPLDCQQCKNLTVRDIIIRNPWNWTATTWNSKDVLFDGLKICGSRMINDDGIDLVHTSNVIIRNCFFRTQDDCIAVKGVYVCEKGYEDRGDDNPIKYDEVRRNDAREKGYDYCENILVENCQFWTDCANIFRIGYECEAAGMRNICAKNIDVLHYSKDANKPTDYWANTIIWLQPSHNMVMEQCHFDQFRIYSDGSSAIMLMAQPMSCHYSSFKIPNTEPGFLKNCSIKNIQVVGIPDNFSGIIHIAGKSPKHSVDGFTLEKITYFGKPILKDSPCVEIGPHSSNIKF